MMHQIRGWLQRAGRLFWPALGVAGVGYAILGSHFDLGRTLRLAAHVNLANYAAALAVFYLASVLRASRWRMLLRNAGERTGLATDWRALMLGWLVNGLIPAKTGDLYRARLLQRRYPIPISKTLGTIVLERLVDFAVMFVLLAGSALVLFRGHLPAPFGAVMAGTSAVLTVLLLAVLVTRLLRWDVWAHLPVRLGQTIARFRAGFVAAPGNLAVLAAITLVLWLTEGVRLYLVLHALPLPSFSLVQVLLVALAGSALTGVPGLPGGAVLVEGGIVASLAYFGLCSSAALSVALLDRGINYWSVLLLGIVLVAVSQPLLRSSLKRLRLQPARLQGRG
jgi:glycosyltransferase 2 family protein